MSNLEGRLSAVTRSSSGIKTAWSEAWLHGFFFLIIPVDEKLSTLLVACPQAQAQAFVPTSPEVQLTPGAQLPAELESQRQSSGLSIARDLVEKLGGVMRIRSPRVADAPVGHWGTHVEIWLPTGEAEVGRGETVLAGSSSDQICV